MDSRVDLVQNDALEPDRQAAADDLFRAIAELKKQARDTGLTDEIIDTELEAWQAERKG